jgi:hypothetical protein
MVTAAPATVLSKKIRKETGKKDEENTYAWPAPKLG